MSPIRKKGNKTNGKFKKVNKKFKNFFQQQQQQQQILTCKEKFTSSLDPQRDTDKIEKFIRIEKSKKILLGEA